MSRLIMIILNLLVREVWDLDLYNDPILVSPNLYPSFLITPRMTRLITTILLQVI